MAGGDFRPLEREDTEDELTDLVRALNETAARLADTIRTLTDERNRSSAILRSMVEGVAVIDAKERVVFCNQAFAEILNVDARGQRRIARFSKSCARPISLRSPAARCKAASTCRAIW